MSVKERELHLQDMASCFIDIAEKYHHSGIFVHPNPGGLENTRRLLEIIRERSGDKFFLTMHGDPTFSIPDGDRMMDFTVSLYEKADALKEESRRAHRGAAEHGRAAPPHARPAGQPLPLLGLLLQR